MTRLLRFTVFIAGLLLLSRNASAQSEADAGAATTPPMIQLAPSMPGGGLYGASPSPAPATTASEPSAAPASSSPAPSGEASPPPPPPSSPAPGAAPWQPNASGPPGIQGLLVPVPVVALAPFDARARRAALNRERLRLLDTTIPPMADRSLRGRLIEGIISLGLGTVMGVVAIFAAPSPGMYDLRPWLWTMAGVTAAEGVVTLAWTPARESLSRQYARMPYATARERHARIRFGEHALDEMASDGSRRRILSSVAGAVIPAGLLLVLYRDPIFNHAPYTFGVFDYLIIGFAGIEVVTSLLGLISRSDEERLRDMYRQQMQMRESEMRTPDQ